MLNYNESTAGADASVKSLKLYDMKLLTLAYLAVLDTRSSSSSLHCAKSGKRSIVIVANKSSSKRP